MPINFSPDDWARIRRDYSAWWDHRLDRPLIFLPEVTEDGRPLDPGPLQDFISNYPAGTAPAEIISHFIAYESQRVYLADTYPVWAPAFGPGILAAVLGARLLARPDTVWFEPAAGVDVANLTISFDRESDQWRRVLALTSAAVDSIGSTVQIAHTDLGANLDVLSGLVGAEPLLLAMTDCPARVAELSAQLTRAWIAAYDELASLIRRRCQGFQSWAPLWAPGTTYFLQSDLSYMISPDMYRRFVLPEIITLSDRLEYPFYHLDGLGALSHVDALLAVKKLRGIQWNPGDGKPPAEEWLDLYQRIRNAGKLVQVVATCEGAKKIVRDIGGRGLHIRVFDQLSRPQAQSFLSEIRSLCA